MAQLKTMRGKYYARIRKWDGVKEKEILVPLRTTFKAVALDLLKDQKYGVNKFEADIKSGIIGSDKESLKKLFPWLNEDGTSSIARLTLAEAVSEFLEYCVNKGNEQRTIDRSICCLKNLIKVLTPKFPVDRLTTDDVERFKKYYKDVKSNNGRNIDLARVRAFVNWLHRHKEMFDGKPPLVEMVKADKKPVSYLSEPEFAEIMQMDTVSDFYKQVFTFYRATGCRAQEPFLGDIEEHGESLWLVVYPDESKTGFTREIQLTPQQASFVRKMRRRKPQETKLKSYTDNFGRHFKRACREFGRGELHFHNLRDTFATMRYLETQDIYRVMKELGHTSLKETVKYANLRLSKVASDFPSLNLDYNGAKHAKNDVRDTLIRDTEPFQVEVASR